MASVYAKSKWALYLLGVPTMQIGNTDNTKDVKQCTMALPHEWVNPLQLKLFFETDNEPYDERYHTSGGGEDADSALNRRVKVLVFLPHCKI